MAKFAKKPEIEDAIDNRFVISIETLRNLSVEVASLFGHSRTKLDWPGDAKTQQTLVAALGGVAQATVIESLRMAGAIPKETKLGSTYV